jgi:hypothetical protein
MSRLRRSIYLVNLFVSRCRASTPILLKTYHGDLDVVSAPLNFKKLMMSIHVWVWWGDVFIEPPTFYSTQLSPDILQIHALRIYACSFRLRVDSGKYNWTNERPGRLEVHVYCTSLSCSSCQQSYPLILLEMPSFANMSSSSIWTSEFQNDHWEDKCCALVPRSEYFSSHSLEFPLLNNTVFGFQLETKESRTHVFFL